MRDLVLIIGWLAYMGGYPMTVESGTVERRKSFTEQVHEGFAKKNLKKLKK